MDVCWRERGMFCFLFIVNRHLNCFQKNIWSVSTLPAVPPSQRSLVHSCLSKRRGYLMSPSPKLGSGKRKESTQNSKFPRAERSAPALPPVHTQTELVGGEVRPAIRDFLAQLTSLREWFSALGSGSDGSPFDRAANTHTHLAHTIHFIAMSRLRIEIHP